MTSRQQEFPLGYITVFHFCVLDYAFSIHVHNYINCMSCTLCCLSNELIYCQFIKYYVHLYHIAIPLFSICRLTFVITHMHSEGVLDLSFCLFISAYATSMKQSKATKVKILPGQCLTSMLIFLLLKIGSNLLKCSYHTKYFF